MNTESVEDERWESCDPFSLPSTREDRIFDLVKSYDYYKSAYAKEELPVGHRNRCLDQMQEKIDLLSPESRKLFDKFRSKEYRAKLADHSAGVHGEALDPDCIHCDRNRRERQHLSELGYL